jgi:hypothetical protein
MKSLRERIENDDLLFDSGIVSHGYAPHMRDYDVVFDVPAAVPPEVPSSDATVGYILGRYRYRFTHCPRPVGLVVGTPRPRDARSRTRDERLDASAGLSRSAR